jgi:hypothetical protein
MDRPSLTAYILENSTAYTRTDLDKMSMPLLVIAKVQIEIELAKKTRASK